jgi:hypothetical protein
VASIVLFERAAGAAFEIGGRDDGGHPDHSTRARYVEITRIGPRAPLGMSGRD